MEKIDAWIAGSKRLIQFSLVSLIWVVVGPSLISVGFFFVLAIFGLLAGENLGSIASEWASVFVVNGVLTTKTLALIAIQVI